MIISGYMYAIFGSIDRSRAPREILSKTSVIFDKQIPKEGAMSRASDNILVQGVVVQGRSSSGSGRRRAPRLWKILG